MIGTKAHLLIELDSLLETNRIHLTDLIALVNQIRFILFVGADRFVYRAD